MDSRHICRPKEKNLEIENNTSVILLAAGNYKYFKRSVSTIELPNGEIVLERQLKAIKKYLPNADITVVLGHDLKYSLSKISEKIQNIRIVINEKFAETNNTKSLYLSILAGQKENLLVINGDILFDYTYIKDCVGKQSTVVIDKTGQITPDEPGTIISNGVVENISHGLDDIWSQIVFLRNEEKQKCKRLISIEKNWNKYLYEILNLVIDDGGIFVPKYKDVGYIKELDNFKDLEKVNEIFI